MCADEERDLQQLDWIDRWLVVTYWRLLLWQHRLSSVTSPVKVGLIHWCLLVAVMLGAPPVGELPAAYLPVMAMGTYALSLTICMVLPRGRHAHA